MHHVLRGFNDVVASRSRRQVQHHENCMFIEDPDIAEAFYEEFCRLKQT